LVFFGSLVSVGQAIFVASYFRGAAYWALAWTVSGFFGWTFGSVVGSSVPMLASQNYDPADPSVLDVLALSCPWVLTSVGHAVVVAAFSSGLRPRRSAALALAWTAAGTVGGIAFNAAAFGLDGQFVEALAETVGLEGGLGEAPVGYPVLVAALYGVPTEVILAQDWVARGHPGPRSS